MAQPAQQILVATDFSASAANAVETASQYARALGASVHLVHVSTPGAPGDARLLSEAAALGLPAGTVRVARLSGDPADEILRYAGRESIDLIVVGTHGRTGVSRLLMGSVAERVVRGARCPVLVAPAHRPAAVPAPAPTGQEPLDADEAVPVARPCLVCATTPTLDLICESCRARIRGEALERKQGEERAGRV